MDDPTAEDFMDMLHGDAVDELVANVGYALDAYIEEHLNPEDHDFGICEITAGFPFSCSKTGRVLHVDEDTFVVSDLSDDCTYRPVVVEYWGGSYEGANSLQRTTPMMRKDAIRSREGFLREGGNAMITELTNGELDTWGIHQTWEEANDRA